MPLPGEARSGGVVRASARCSGQRACRLCAHPRASNCASKAVTTMAATEAMAKDEPLHALLDEHLIAYLRAYEEYTTCHVEMEAQLRDGYMAFSRARRDLLRSNTALGQTLFPQEIDPLIVVGDESAEGEDQPPTLQYHFCEDGATVVGADTNDDEPVAQPQSAPATGDEADRETIAALERMGVDPALQREIAAAVRDDGDNIGVACGNSLAIDPPSGGGTVLEAQSEMRFAASNMNDLKHAQFRAALAEADKEPSDSRPKPQVKPSSSRDPLRWYGVLPPPSLRQTQKNFRRAAETAVALANANAKMHVARQRYVTLRQKLRQGEGEFHDAAGSDPKAPPTSEEL